VSQLSIPLFPLHTVLFPGGPLALRIFEQRYLDMVRDCVKNDSGMGVCLIRDGREVGDAAIPFEIGTLSRINYWHRRADGLLGITVVGERRFRLLEAEVADNMLCIGRVELLPEEPAVRLPAEHRPLVEMLQGILDQLDHPYRTLERHYDDAGWVAGRLAELSPLPLLRKQRLLQTDDPLERLDELAALLLREE